VNLPTEYEHITPLINVISNQAVKNKHILMVKLLLDNGASPDLIDAKGKSALDYARLTRDEKICRLLESAQCQTTMKSSSYDTMERIQQLKSETQPPKEDEYEEDFE
jgi:ankyrin repeat protein